MKEIFLLTILLFQLTFAFGQYGANKDCAESGCGDKSKNITRCWGVARSFEQGIQIRVKGPIENCYNAINSESNRHSFMWHIEITGLGKVKQDCKLYITGGDNRKSDYMIVNNTDGNILTDKMTVDFFTFSNAETIGLEVLPYGNTSTNKNSNQQTSQQNDLTEYNRSKAEMEQKMQQQNQEIANSNAEAQRQQQLLKQQQEQQRQQQLEQGINQVTTATVDLLTYFSNRKNALRNSLSKEDGQALVDIANSENPTNYTQNIIQIFKDLGYTLRETEHKDGYVIIALNNDVASINDFMLIFVRPASYDYYNSISFSYHRKQKLREQLAVLGDKLKGSDGLELQGISASNKLKKKLEDEKKLSQRNNEVFRKIDYLNSNSYNKPFLQFHYSMDIAKAYFDKEQLNDRELALIWYKKAAEVNIDSLVADSPSLEKQSLENYSDVCYKIGYLLASKNGEEAIQWYLKSVSKSKTGAYLNIGLIYKFGFGGVTKDWQKAAEYFEKDIDKKSADAMYNLGKLYEVGGPNLEKDDSRAKKLFKKACKEEKKYCN